MPFNGGGGGALPAHEHTNIANDGGPLDFNNTTVGSMNAGDMTYSDGAALQQLAIAAPNDQLRVSAGNIPEWYTPAAAASTWTKLGEVTLGVAATTIDVTWALADVKDFLRVFVYTLDGGGTIRRYLSFYDSAGVADVGNNYASQWNTSFGGVSTAINATGIAGTDNGSAFETIDVGCYDSTECKLVVRHGCGNTSNSAGVSPTSRQIFGEWADITNEVRGVKIWDGGSGGLFAAGSSMLVLGTDL